MNIDTRCPHERGEVKPATAKCADHKPLTLAELEGLLQMAVTANCQHRVRIQVRLNQAIPGMTCPRPINGVAAAKMGKIGKLYVATNPKDLPGKAREFWEIIKG